MPPEVIGASNATRGYWGVKCHPEVIGASKAQGSQKAGASKGPIAAGRQKPQGVRVQGVKIRASGFTSSNVPGVKGDESNEFTIHISENRNHIGSFIFTFLIFSKIQD